MGGASLTRARYGCCAACVQECVGIVEGVVPNDVVGVSEVTRQAIRGCAVFVDSTVFREEV